MRRRTSNRHLLTTTLNKELIAHLTSSAESLTMKTFILSLSATLLVMLITPPTTKVIQDKPVVKKQSIIQPLQAPVYAEKQQVAKVPVAPPKTAPVASGGSWVDQCHAWAAQAGITLNDSAIKLLERESHCNPLARNPSSSAGGIPQALPWTKMGCQLTAADAPCQLKWFQSYVFGRYGSYDKALAHSYANNWY